MRQADEIRRYAVERYVAPARDAGEPRVAIRAGDVHKALELEKAHYNVCQVLDGAIFHRKAGVRPVDYNGPPSRRGPNAEFVYRVLPMDDWHKRVMELPIGEFEDLVSDYLRAKGFSDAEIVLKVKE